MARTTADRHYQYYPAFLDLVRKRVVIVGGGAIATGKVRGLLACGPAPLVVIAPQASGFIQEQAALSNLDWQARVYQSGDLTGADLVFAATDDRATNAEVAREARARAIPVLAVDDVPHCDFIAPAVVRRGDLTIAISTHGRSPALARRAREHLESAVPDSWGRLLDVAATVRERLGSSRRRIAPERWQAALRGEVERLVAQGAIEEAADRLLERLLQTGIDPEVAAEPVVPPAQGLVSLVGAGPGDPELLTLKALRRLQEAAVVVHDRLIGLAVLEHCAPDAERVDVGKTPGGKGWTQEAINALLVGRGRRGQRVVRLKGGDPFVFGRGGEEALALHEAGVAYEVVPGVSAALAAPAAASIPVTHRGLAASVTIATGHGREGGEGADHDWQALARMRGTLVFLMGVEHLDHISDRLLAYGRDPRESAALVRWGTTPQQEVLTAPLGEIAARAREQQLRPPAVLVVGPTVDLAAALREGETPADQFARMAAAEPRARELAHA